MGPTTPTTPQPKTKAASQGRGSNKKNLRLLKHMLLASMLNVFGLLVVPMKVTPGSFWAVYALKNEGIDASIGCSRATGADILRLSSAQTPAVQRVRSALTLLWRTSIGGERYRAHARADPLCGPRVHIGHLGLGSRLRRSPVKRDHVPAHSETTPCDTHPQHSR